MRKSRTETAQTRASIVSAAADHLRKVGIAQASLADVMASAGLTHGGFYRHFESKEQLVAEALQVAVGQAFTPVIASFANEGANAAVAGYLSHEHRDAPVPACPFAALGSELRNAGDAPLAVAAEALEALVGTMSGNAPAGAQERAAALATLSTMVGAMTLARAVPPGPLSDEILQSARDALRR